LPNDFF
jgi:hypothetical protein